MSQTENGVRFLRCAFIVCVLSLAIFQFSENTADPDLWAHVLFGEHFLQTHELMKNDPYSWTASGHEWINHEVLAEIALGLAHRALGGAGLLLLKMAVGLLTFFIALRTAKTKTQIIAWAFGALAVVEISFGFAARPQIFSALALALQLWLLQKIHSGKCVWAIALPPLFALWINTHGGVLAGIILLFATAGATTLQFFLKKFAPQKSLWLDSENSPQIAIVLWICAFASAAAMLLNPWGATLIRWLVESVLWLRPEIGEWNSTALNWDHAAFFACALLAALAFLLSRQPRALWQIATLIFLGLMATRSVRHTPLFCVAALAFVPAHLADVWQRFRAHFQQFEKIGETAAAKKVLAGILFCLALAILISTVALHKERAWTMEIPRAQYPVSAVQFIRAHGLRGNQISFFDWGEMCLWDLPGSRVSIDGRLDTSYPRAVIDAHWNFYNDRTWNQNALNLENADYALLPSNLAGAMSLAKKFGWQPVYLDKLAVVLVKNPNEFPGLAHLNLPVENGIAAVQGRAPFPDLPSARIAK